MAGTDKGPRQGRSPPLLAGVAAYPGDTPGLSVPRRQRPRAIRGHRGGHRGGGGQEFGLAAALAVAVARR